MANPDEYDALKSGASGAATGAAFGGPVGAVIGGVAGAATPFISKALGGLFGVTDAEDAEKAALAPLQRVATGGTTQGQAGMAYARARTLQDLQGMANRGTAQQQAGLQRQAMQQAPEIQARYASQLADLRSKEQERASSQLAYYEGQRAAADAKRKREALSGAIGSAVSMGTKLGMASGASAATEQATKDEAFKKALGIGSPASGGISSAEAGTALFGAAPAAAAPAAAGMASAAAPVGMAASGTNFSDLDPSVAASLKTGTPGYEDVEQADPNTQYQHFPGAFGGSIRNRPVGVTGSEQATVNAAAGAQDAQNLATFNQLSAAGPGRGFTSDIGGSTARMDANADRMRRSLTAQVGDKPASPASLSQAVALSQPAPPQPARDFSAGASEDPMRGIAYSTDPYAPENLASAVPNTGRRPRAIRGSR